MADLVPTLFGELQPEMVEILEQELEVGVFLSSRRGGFGFFQVLGSQHQGGSYSINIRAFWLREVSPSSQSGPQNNRPVSIIRLVVSPPPSMSVIAQQILAVMILLVLRCYSVFEGLPPRPADSDDEGYRHVGSSLAMSVLLVTSTVPQISR